MQNRDEHEFKFVLMRYVPDFTREEFVNAGMVFYDKTSQSIRGRIVEDQRRLKCLNPAVNYKHFVRYAKGLIRHVEEITRNKVAFGNRVLLGEAVAAAFEELSAQNAGFLTASNVKSGLTDDVVKEFDKLYNRYVLVKKSDDEDTVKAYRSIVKTIYSIIRQIGDRLIVKPHERSFYYPVTEGEYKCEVSFNGKHNINLKALSLRAKNNYPYEMENILSAITILSDLKETHKKYKFGGLIYFSPKYNKDAQEAEFRKLKERFTKSKLECVRANMGEMEKYFKNNNLINN